ncbi:DUF2283 domain-containing protein [Arthrobacter sp. R1-13]
MTYDQEADAVYVYFADEILAGDVKKTYLCDPIEVDGMINLDFDRDGRLVRVEVLDAKSKLPPELLDRLIQG